MASQLGALLISLWLLASVAFGAIPPVAAQAQQEEVDSQQASRSNPSVGSHAFIDEQATATNETTLSCDSATSTELNNTRELRSAVDDCASVAYASPPPRAEAETTRRFDNLTAGNETTSRYPSDATLAQTAAVADAHASIYGIHPSTHLQREDEASQLLIAPTGVVRALVDYRLSDPSRIHSHEIESVRLLHNATIVDERNSSSQTPRLEYTGLPTGPATLTVEASIRVVRQETVGGGATERVSELVTVRDHQKVVVTAITPETVRLKRAQQSSGRQRVAVSHPYWQQVSLATTTEATESNRSASTTEPQITSRVPVTVQSSWRFSIGTDDDWAALYTATPSGVVGDQTDLAPKYVYATRPPPADSPLVTRSANPAVTRVTRWEVHQSAEIGSSLGAPQDVGESNNSSSATVPGVTFRLRASADRPRVSVTGLVRGTNGTLALDGRPAQSIHQPDLSITIVEQNASTATLRVTLRDPQSGAPIGVAESDATDTGGAVDVGAALSVNGRSVSTDEQGHYRFEIDEYGTHSVRFEPPLLTTATDGRIYSGASATTAWHPLQSVAGWVSLVSTLLSWGVLSLILLYAGRRLGRLLQPSDYL